MAMVVVLLVFGFLPIIIGLDPAKLNENDIMDIIKKDYLLTGSEYQKLRLSKGGMLGENEFAITWKGSYNNNNQTVAVKIFWDQEAYHHELSIYKALNATEFANIEDYGIAKVFYYGKILKEYNTIAMTLFDETLEHRFQIQRRHFSDLSILMIFMQMVETLKYLKNKGVLHNDIRPENIFLRGTRAFISDFRLATKNSTLHSGGNITKFASSNVYAKKHRCEMDDLESLLFTIWHVAGVPEDRILHVGSHQPQGYVLYNSYEKGNAKDIMQKKCEYFKDPIVKEVFETICVHEIITRKSVPDYVRIFNLLVDAVNKLNPDYKPLRFEWIKGTEHWITQFVIKTAKSEFQKYREQQELIEK